MSTTGLAPQSQAREVLYSTCQEACSQPHSCCLIPALAGLNNEVFSGSVLPAWCMPLDANVPSDTKAGNKRLKSSLAGAPLSYISIPVFVSITTSPHTGPPRFTSAPLSQTMQQLVYLQVTSTLPQTEPWAH